MHQVFIYIMVVLVVGAILLFGYKAIDNILDKTCQVEETTFVKGIDNILKKMTKDDVENKPLKVPCSYEEVCFLNGTISTTRSTELEEKYPLIKNEYSAPTGNNVFLVKRTLTKPINAFEGLVVENGFLCVENKGGNFNLIFKGLGGGRVLISES